MASRKTAEARLWRVFVAAAVLSTLAMAALSITALRSPGRGYLVVAVCAAALAIAVTGALIRRHRQRKSWPGLTPLTRR
ncbi:MAG TPA: hypothetical protein VG674_06325 [Amycolatopsis sp.]|nr:hypothetical protein [Amycolatopsis sp.]